MVEEHFSSPNEELKLRRKELTENIKTKLAETDGLTLFKLFEGYLKILYDEIPKEGKIGYNTPNMEKCRPTIDKAIELILNNECFGDYYLELKKQVEENDLEIINTCKKYNLEPDKYLYSKTFDEDIKRRMGNILIKEIIKRRKKAYEEYQHIRNDNLRRKNELKVNVNLAIHSIAIVEEMINGIDEAFEEYLRRIKKAEIDRLIEEGIIDIDELETEM